MDFCANNNVSTEKQDQLVDHGPNRVGHSIPISGCYGPWVIVSQFSTPLVAWRPDGMELHRRVFRVLSHRFQTAKLWQMLCPDKCGCPQNSPSVMFFQTNLQEYSCKKITTAKYPAKTTVNCFERKGEGVLLPNVPLCKVSTHHARA